MINELEIDSYVWVRGEPWLNTTDLGILRPIICIQIKQIYFNKKERTWKVCCKEWEYNLTDVIPFDEPILKETIDEPTKES